MNGPRPGNKYIVGWITLREGVEGDFDRIVMRYVEECRQEPECRFFEMIRTRENPLSVLVCECFDSEEAHAVHRNRPHVKAMFRRLGELALIGNFENVIAGEINPDAYDFSAQRPA